MKLHHRRDGTSEAASTTKLRRRLRLRRSDGRIYLDRWGIAHDRIGGVMLHRMAAPDPGIDLHDHPWWFATVVLWGGYTEQRAYSREAPMMAKIAEHFGGACARGVLEERLPFRPRTMRLDECHTITELRRRTCWTLVVRGPRRRSWGFYLTDGYVDERTYDETVRADRRDMWNEAG